MVSRRLFLSFIGLGATALPGLGAAGTPVLNVDLRGAIDASAHGVRPGGDDRKSKAFAKLLDTGRALRAALRDAFAGRGLAGAPAALQKQQREEVAALVADGGRRAVAGSVRRGRRRRPSSYNRP